MGQNFFIEPTTGETHSLDWDQYQGIEVLWNHKNYWVNMQDCAQGVEVDIIIIANITLLILILIWDAQDDTSYHTCMQISNIVTLLEKIGVKC